MYNFSTSLHTAKERHALHYLSVLREASQLFLQSGDSHRAGIESFDLEAANIRAGREWAVKQAEKSEETAITAYNYPFYS